ncbi:CAP-Gly domain-containing protein [Coprinopsis cinerea okayama7|uniref:CAP-Gly domain-containing protein n=1 Tax=Coprinopsis cinerea (strain Okayama-7 / 130 / ATCC MYA-4618 / FGSC 9003) TaxID=240176 RepID=D6RL91_COPC7|nr:CAP-Gly domain-containing protein [Coprinopsis cinerea okayama7\|eukprot:XP_002911693.1 CAP-Gly domain-containing protein [Coprinopsis cinerea okayama7\
MATPGKPRPSAMPQPGRASSIPTPGRSRSASSLYQGGINNIDDRDMTRAFADAIKANDPAQHRITTHHSSTSLSPKSTALAQSGRRSVAAGRPPSSASSVSAFSQSTRAGAKTPGSARAPSRPPSRHSDLHSKNRTFEVGDNVRIESLGFEGVLRYLGEIDGKPGQWAGVELGGGFAGKGKNDGSVSGKRYFECPPSCGVFVAIAKLSAPTVGPGAVPRPPSVASTRNGRVTPAMSGRITPSFSSQTFSGFSARTPSASFANGRMTPANTSGRITPSMSTSRIASAITPSAKPRQSLAKKSPGLTAGSRASKYANMTAKDLTNSRSTKSSPSPKTARVVSSPTRGPGSPFTTPKALTASKLNAAFGKGRPSGTTPRARLPSSVSMPPPASPFSKSHPNHHDEAPESISQFRLFGDRPDSRPGSSASVRSDDNSLIGRLQSRLEALEYENERLRIAAASAPTSQPEPAADDAERLRELEELRGEKDGALSRVTDLEEELKQAKSLTSRQEQEVASLNSTIQALQLDLDKEKADRLDDQQAFTSLQAEMQDVVKDMEQLQKVFDDQQASQSKLDEDLQVKEAEIEALQSKLAQVTAELEEERKELGTQIDELRIAGQETIALYEERLSEIEGHRYDLETRLNALLEKAASQDQPELPPRMGETAAEIDNETLREQVIHLQKKISMMEDIIEDHRANAEKEEATHRERMKRLKEKEESMKKELNEGRKEVERVVRAEQQARNRVEEIEEALRESTLALENARAEIEMLRSELANLDGLVEGSADMDGDLSTRITAFTRRMGVEREQKDKEIERLKAELKAARESPEILDLTAQLNATRLDLEERERDIKELKKRMRDVPVVNGSLDTSKALSPTSSKSDSKEEVTGLKHIIQELQKDNSASLSKIHMLESENEHLRSEVEQLRQEVRILEENLDDSLQNDDLPDDTSLLQRRTKQQALEIEQLRKKLSDLEVNHGRTIHELNKEIGELEALVESKIYREDELEQEIERLKEKISRAKKRSVEPSNASNRLSTSSVSSSEVVGNSGSQVCEICERPGHDIFNCDLLKDDMPTTPSTTSSELVCADCETPGHTASECPYSQDVF